MVYRMRVCNISSLRWKPVLLWYKAHANKPEIEKSTAIEKLKEAMVKSVTFLRSCTVFRRKVLIVPAMSKAKFPAIKINITISNTIACHCLRFARRKMYTRLARKHWTIRMSTLEIIMDEFEAHDSSVKFCGCATLKIVKKYVA